LFYPICLLVHLHHCRNYILKWVFHIFHIICSFIIHLSFDGLYFLFYLSLFLFLKLPLFLLQYRFHLDLSELLLVGCDITLYWYLFCLRFVLYIGKCYVVTSIDFLSCLKLSDHFYALLFLISFLPSLGQTLNWLLL